MTLSSTNGVLWPSVESYRAAAQLAVGELEMIRDLGPMTADTIPLIAVVKNEKSTIEAFLAHYRGLGVTRFMLIDNGSDDGTFEILSTAPDVDLWRTHKSFAAANHGCLWVDGLLQAVAKDRWILHVDADEFLIFPNLKETTNGGNRLQALVKRLEWRGETRLFAPMLDMYSDRPIRETKLDPGVNPLSKLCWFDGEPEHFINEERGVWIAGGPRRRLFFADEPETLPGLGKYPLVYYDSATAFIGIHTPTPASRNYLRPQGRLLHIKLHAGLAEKANAAVANGQYWQDSREYKRYKQVLSEQPDLSAYYAGSVEYVGPQTLLELGFMYEPKAGLADLFKRFLRKAAP